MHSPPNRLTSELTPTLERQERRIIGRQSRLGVPRMETLRFLEAAWGALGMRRGRSDRCDPADASFRGFKSQVRWLSEAICK